MSDFVSFTLGGVSIGMVYAAIALSLVLIWRATRIVNFAQGGMATLTTFIALGVIHATGSYWLGFLTALAAGFVLGGIIERFVMRPVENKPQLNPIIVTIGLLILIEGAAALIYGGAFRSFPAEGSIVGYKVGNTHINLSPYDVFVTAAVIVVALILYALFQYTAVGLRMRAAAFSPGVARLLGVRVGRVLTLGWALAGLIGALAGVLVSPTTFLYPNNMDVIFVLGFTAAILGGLDSPVGAVIGGLMLGIFSSWVDGYLGADFETIFALLLLLAVLMLRPSGLFSSARTRQV